MYQRWPNSIPMVRCPSLSVHIFKFISTETTGPIKVRVYMEHLCLTGTKAYIIGPGHMTKVPATPIYGKTPLKIFSRTISQKTLKLGTQQKGLEPYKLYKLWPWSDLDLFYNQVNFVRLVFYIGKVHPHFQTSPQKPRDRLVRFKMEHLCLEGTKFYINGPGHMTKIASMSIYAKKTP